MLRLISLLLDMVLIWQQLQLLLPSRASHCLPSFFFTAVESFVGMSL